MFSSLVGWLVDMHSTAASLILDCIFSMLLCDFRVREQRSVPTPSMTALTEIFYADVEMSIHCWNRVTLFLLRYDSIYVLECTLYLYSALPQTLSASVTGLFYLKWQCVLCFCIYVICV